MAEQLETIGTTCYLIEIDFNTKNFLGKKIYSYSRFGSSTNEIQMRENPDADNSSSFKGPFLSLKKCVENALDFADKWSYDMVFHKGDSDYLLLTGTIRDVLGSGKYDDVEITVSPF